MTAYDYDLFTIGAGSGGVRASRLSSEYGARVAVAEQGCLGGTCVNVGCVPKKLMVYASHFAEEARTAERFGWAVDGASHDWNTFIERKNREIERLNGIYRGILDRAHIDLFEAPARIVSPHTLRVGERTVTAHHILLATGSRPRLPVVPGAEYTAISDDIFSLPSCPRRAVIVGGGYIAVEFAGIFHGLGSDVVLVHRGDNVLRGFDHDIRLSLRDAYREKGIGLQLSNHVSRVEKTAGRLVVHLEDGSTLDADLVLFAIGRQPSTHDLGLDLVEVDVDDAGAVIVDALSQTTSPCIHAIGDVTNRMNLTPVAIAEGAALARTLFRGEPTRVDYADVPSAVFSQPAIGTVGLTEADARLEFEHIDIYRTSFRPMKYALGDEGEPTMMKLVVDRASDRVVGAHMVGPDAGEIIQGIAIALKCGATKADFDATVGIHPTSAEEWVTMREPVAPPELPPL